MRTVLFAFISALFSGCVARAETPRFSDVALCQHQAVGCSTLLVEMLFLFRERSSVGTVLHIHTCNTVNHKDHYG